MKLSLFAAGLPLIYLALFSMTPIAQAQSFEEKRKLLASDGAAIDNFGDAVALSGSTAVCGAPFNDALAQDTGAVYLFERDQGGPDSWGELKKITASDAAALDRFGTSVAVSGDVLIVGSSHNDGIGLESGAAYVFSRDLGGPDNWGQVKKLIASDADGSDLFGDRVAIDGDLLVVGAPGEDQGGISAGAAYVFARNEGGTDNWGEVKKWVASDAAASDQFGISVAISGDTVVVGAFAANSPAIDAGAAYVFERNEGGTDNWGEVKKLVASDAAASDQFGRELAVDDDTIVVGVYIDNNASGSAYIFERDQGGPGNWGEARKIVAADAANGDQFGRAVAVGDDTIVVVALRDDDACPADPNCDSGSAYVFKRDQGGPGNWGQTHKLTASDAALGDLFGRSVSLSGQTLLLGAPADDDGGSNAGSAYVFSSETASAPNLTVPSNIPIPSNLTVDVPITFNGNGSDISSLAFSIDFDETCLSFDPTDGDSDGIPDAVVFSVPPDFTPSVTFAAADTSGELDVVIADFSPPLSALADGMIATVTLSPICTPAGANLIAPVIFGASPTPSFGDTLGQSIPGTWTDGSVEIFAGTPGDCNDDDIVDAGDISACVLEVFDGDGNLWTDVVAGSFLGSPVGCDANQDFLVDAGDLTCKILLIFNGPGACTPAPLRSGKGQPEMRLGHAVGAGPGEEIEIPLTFHGSGQDIAAATLSIDFDEACLSFDPADGISFDLPAGMTPSVSFDAGDTEGELDITLMDPALPFAVLGDGPIATLRLTALCAQEQTVPVRFSSELSFGSTGGQSVQGLGVDGSVTFGPAIFVDGFESGSTARWSQEVSGAQ